ncbi:hypothetical protein GCM10027586_00810 [Kineococcus gypseus]|uniref:hypothetical protein n=1 Tax=Kineococcus gypseus TaxID=1637102 RepID=UPI003D7E257D
MSELAEFFVHTVHVQTYQGEGAWGATWDEAPTPVLGFLDERRSLVRGAGGDEVVSSATFHCSVQDGERFTPESKVTVHRGTPLQRATHVLSLAVHTSGPLHLPDHAQITLA